MNIQKVRVADFSHGGDILPAVKRDLRKAGGYFIIPEEMQVKPDIEIEIVSINKGGEDEDVVLEIACEDTNQLETMRQILTKRFSKDRVTVRLQSRANPENDPPDLYSDARVLNFLAYMRGFEGVDFT